MNFLRTKRKCPVCDQMMVRKKKSYNCPDCGTRFIGDTLLRPKLSADALREFGHER